MARRGRVRYQYTHRRRVALRKAQLASARKRKGRILLGVGVLAVGAGAAVVYGAKVRNREGSPMQVGQPSNSPPQAVNNNSLASQLAALPPRRVLVTGSRNWSNTAILGRALDNELLQTGALTVVHGGSRGADRLAESWANARAAQGYNVRTEVHEADWNTHGKAAGPLRNAAMVNLGADMVLGFPIGVSKGTRDAMHKAAVVGIPIRKFEG